MMNPFHQIGVSVARRYASVKECLAFLGEAFAASAAVLVRPWQFRFRDWSRAFARAAFDGLPVTTGIGFLLGVILAFESAAALRTFGAEVYVADLLTISLFRELGPLVTAIVLAGRSGSAFAAEIGTMKVDEELDALKTMGLPPVKFLVVTRVMAAVLAMPILTVFSELAGLVGGALVLGPMNVPNVVFWNRAGDAISLFPVVFGLVKAGFFGLLIGLIGCGAGLRTRSTADGVGVAATTAVVGSIVAIAIADGLFAVVCYVWGV